MPANLILVLSYSATRISKSSSIGAVKKRRTVIELLDDYKAEKKHTLAIEFRLTNIPKMIEWWRTIGCQLWFASTGKLEPDHDMNSYKRGADCKRAKLILLWLESLDIPRSSSRGRGCCSICAPFHPCSEVVIGDHAEMARSLDGRNYWTKHFESKAGQMATAKISL